MKKFVKESCVIVTRVLGTKDSERHANIQELISMFHRAFFNSIIDKHQHMHFFIQHSISLECSFH